MVAKHSTEIEEMKVKHEAQVAEASKSQVDAEEKSKLELKVKGLELDKLTIKK